MFVKFLRFFSFTFILFLALLFGYYLKEMADMIPSKYAERSGDVSGTEQQRNITEVEISGEVFKVEVAEAPEDRRKGLMYRPYLDDKVGMLFIFENEGYHSFWMKNTRIPLDMIWISANNKVVHIQESAPPCGSGECKSYKSSVPGLYVLELNSGSSARYGIEVGDDVLIR